MTIKLKEKEIRSLIRSSLLKEGLFSNVRAATGRTTFPSRKKEEELEDFSVEIPDSDFIHPIVDFAGGATSPPSSNRNGNPHQGYDFAVAVGNGIVSVAPGKVVTASSGGGAGNFIVIDHEKPIAGDNSFSAYMHLDKKLVKQGEKVKGGQLIGLSGNTGKSTGPHLHFQLGRSKNTREHSTNKDIYDAFLEKCQIAKKIKGKKSKDKSGPDSIQFDIKNRPIEVKKSEGREKVSGLQFMTTDGKSYALLPVKGKDTYEVYVFSKDQGDVYKNYVKLPDGGDSALVKQSIANVSSGKKIV